MNLRTEDLSWRDVENDVVILDEVTWKYLHLNESASVLWRALVGGAAESDLEKVLVAAFPDASASASADVEAFLSSLRERGYLQA